MTIGDLTIRISVEFPILLHHQNATEIISRLNFYDACATIPIRSVWFELEIDSKR